MIKLGVALATAGLALILFSLLPVRAVTQAAQPAQSPTAAVQDEVANGKALFLAKGCVTCHHHAAVAGSGALDEGVPDLTAGGWDAAYLRRWLDNPAAVKPGTSMPRLDLKPDEIEALIAFLSANKG